MGAKLPRAVEPKTSFPISLELSIKLRFMAVVHEYSVLKQKNMSASSVLREYIIKTIERMEKEIEDSKK